MSRFDFGSILAKAEKNSNQAQRVLEEKKALQKKSRPPGEASKSQPDTKALQDYLEKKREEQRLQNLKEQQEILRQRRLKDEANAKISDTSDKKKSTTTVKSTPNGTNGEKSTKKPVSSASVKQSTTTSKKPSESLKSSGSVKEKPRSVSAKPSLNNGKSSNESRPKPQGPPQPEQVKQPVRSYQDILKLAEARSASTAAQKQPALASKDARKSDITANNSKPNRPVSAAPLRKSDIGGLSVAAQNYLSQLRPDQILKLQQRQGIIKRPRPNGAGVNNTSTDKKISNSDAKLNNIINNKPTSVKPISNSGPGTARPMSTWDRLMADMKKNSNAKPISNKPRIDQPKRKEVEEYDDYYDDYDDDDEYDSEMDDFIDDTDGLDKSVTDEIRRLFRYDPKKYKHIDDEDIDNMESDFATIQREERQTLKLGMIEDAIELEREQEMERRRMEKKKRLDDAEHSSKRSPEKKFKS